MKKLSIKNKTEEISYILGKEVKFTIIKDGFSGFKTSDNETIRGACTSCKDQFCMKYSNNEISPKRFQAFEKNPSSRVCPTNAIDIDVNNKASINSGLCIKCGLCIHRCPYAAIQFSIYENSCSINIDTTEYKQAELEQQNNEIAKITKVEKIVSFQTITQTFCSDYQYELRKKVKQIPDLSEIIVRNTLINLGCICATKPAGNNHIRTEFFAEIEDKVIIGESEITDTDTLSVSRRILDDLTILISRNGFEKQDIIPLAVINGLPNKRTDFYEVISDINNVIDVQISTITYYLLFVLQLFRVSITPLDIQKYVVDKEHFSLIEAIKKHLENICEIDENIEKSGNYTPAK